VFQKIESGHGGEEEGGKGREEGRKEEERGPDGNR